MKNDETELWERLQSFSFDDPEAAFSFSRRLARESGWNLSYTERVIEEYRRFLFLAATSAEPVTPSDDVDQAWHLHLCYSRSYWNELCGEVLKRPLHHGPTKGGAVEADKFQDWYARTLVLYESAFGSIPPRDVWPNVEDRFAIREWTRVDRSTHFVLPKRSVRLAAAVVVIGLVTVGCSVTTEEWVGTILAVVLVTGVSMAAIALSKKGGGGKGGGSGCHAGGGSGCHAGGGMGCGTGKNDSGCGSGCGGGGCGGGCGGS